MRNLKKFLALVLAMMMAFSLMVTANATNPKYDYPDVEDATFSEAIDVLTGMGVFRGDNGEFKPDRPIMRSEAVAVLYRLVTGDVSDSQAELYAPAAAQFTDVVPNAWYAGYVGFAVDAGFVKGYNGEFMPNKNVTGYEMLAMLLRAVGYGKNGEFTGSQWMINVGSQAQALGILNNIQSTNYANTLSRNSTREVVAELTFETAAYVPTVRYEYGYYNQYKGVAIAQGDNEKNPTLGEIKFGLTGQTGIIVGNQATGEDYTLLGVNTTGTWNVTDSKLTNLKLGQSGSYVYATDNSTAFNATTTSANATLAYDIDTGLKLFGHKATVWYNNGTSMGNQRVGDAGTGANTSAGYVTTYAVVDNAKKTAYVYSDDAILSQAGGTLGTSKLAAAANTAGFKKVQPNSSNPNNSQAYFSDRYCQMGTLANDGTANKSPISTYALISNNGNLSVDVVVALSAEVAQITQKNTTAKYPYLILGTDDPNVSTFGDGTDAGKIMEYALTADSVKELGKIVTAYEVVGTTDSDGNDRALGDVAGKEGGDELEDCLYQLEDMKTFTATVSSYKLGTDAADNKVNVDGTASDVISVNLVGRSDPMLLSGIVKGDGTNSEIISEILEVITALDANTTYTVYEDIVGRFISLETDSPYKFLYGTYADFEVGTLGTGTIGYNMVGVNWDGEKLGSNPVKYIGGYRITGELYNALTVTRKDYGMSGNTTAGNELNGGYDTGYMYNANTGDLQLYTGKKMVDGAGWTITSNDAANGFKKVNNSADGTSGTDYLLTKDTRFIVVSGTGTATLKVEQYKGLADFLQGSATAVISYADEKNEVIFKTEAEKYGTVDTNDNGVITDIILSDKNVNRWNSTTMYFNYQTQDDEGTGMVLPGANPTVYQYELWCDGKLDYYFVETSTDADKGGSDAVKPVTAMTFYNLVKIDEIGGVPVYKATTAPVSDGKGNLSSAGYASNNITYEYITVSTLDTGLFSDDGGTTGKVFSIAGAKVCDVQYKSVSTTAGTRSEITTLRELNNAVSVRKLAGATNYTIGVAIVYEKGINVVTIYVTDVSVVAD